MHGFLTIPAMDSLAVVGDNNGVTSDTPHRCHAVKSICMLVTVTKEIESSAVVTDKDYKSE